MTAIYSVKDFFLRKFDYDRLDTLHLCNDVKETGAAELAELPVIVITGVRKCNFRDK